MRYLLAVLFLGACGVVAQDLQQVADGMAVKSPVAGQKKLEMPAHPKGTRVKVLASDYEQIINDKGEIVRRPLSDTPVRVSFVVRQEKKQVISRDYEIIVPGSKAAVEGANPKPHIIPDLLSWHGDVGQLVLPKVVTVWGEDSFVPELVRELNAVLPEGYRAEQAAAEEGATIRLTEGKGRDEEAYGLTVNKKYVSISASGKQGRYWGTRTLLQMLVQNPAELPCGKAWDAPRYKLRGLMLDVGRLPIPLDYLYEVVRLMAWYKMNDLQLHLNDNYIFHEHYVKAGQDPLRMSYSAFRMQSDVKGKDGTPLTAQDLFYRKAEFRALVAFAAERGVHIVPEFDAPGHALSFTRVRPDLIYQGPMKHVDRRCEMLDAANPETLKFVGRVWDEFLTGKNPAFGGCRVVHVGADEFFGEAEDYRRFADGLLKHILKRGYTPRIWGSLKAKTGKTPVQVKGVQMNLWSVDWGTAWQSVNLGYDVITTFDRDLYVVPFASYYRADNNRKQLYETWVPNRFGKESLPAGHPQLLGATFAVWNDEIDRLHRGYGSYDLWPVIDGMVNVLAQKMWGQPTPPRSYEEHCALAERVGNIPCCDPLHRAAEPFELAPTRLPLKLGKGSCGPGYHLTVELLLEAEPVAGKEQVLLESDQGQLLAAGKDGRITLRRSDSIEFAYNAKLPVGKKVRLELIGSMGKTELLIDGVSAGEPENVRFPLRQEGRMSTFVLPLQQLGGSFKGKVFSIKLEKK